MPPAITAALKLIKQVLTYIRKVPGYFQDQIALLIFSLIFSGISLLMPIIIKYLIDTVMTTHNYDLIFKYFIAMLGLNILSHLGETWQSLIGLRHNQKVTFRLRDFFVKMLLRQNILFHVNIPAGQIMARVQNDVNTFAGFISNQLNSLTVLVLEFLIMFFVLFDQNKNLTLIAVLNIPVYVIILWRFHPKRKRLAIEATQKNAEMIGVVQDVFDNIKLVKVYAVELMALKKINAKIRQTISLAFDNFRVNFWFGFTILISLSMGPLLVLYFGIQSVKTGTLTLGSLYLFITYMGRLLAPVEGMKNFAGSGMRAKVALDRIEEYIPRDGENKSVSSTRQALGCIEQIQAKKLQYAYPGRETLFQDVDFEMKKGEVYALMGDNGSGKSTLAALLLNLIFPVRGSIEYNGVNLETISKKELHRKIIMVPQESFFMNDTLRENITLGDKQIPHETVKGLCQQMGIHETIIKMPQRYETHMGENGLKLSGGERQRLALVRAMLFNPDVLILDEALSEVDAESELRILKSIQEIMAHKIMILISHENAVQGLATRLYYLKQGKLIETQLRQTGEKCAHYEKK